MLEGFEFWEKTLGKPKYMVAPMVDQSELAWRMLSRKYGAQLCYSPMYHASVFLNDEKYRRDALASCPEDRPLIIQFCANDPEVLLKAGLKAQDHCDAIDLNLGCPQAIAKRGHYGAFLQDDWDLIQKMVTLCHEKLSVPITCKIRVFESLEKTVKYAKLLQNSGCQILTVHGRTREQKGPLTGLANWEYIKAIKTELTIPVFANGNIQYYSDIDRCINETGVDGIMTAEGNLHNPAIFSNMAPDICDISLEYLDLVEKYPPCPLSYVRGHIFKLCVHSLQKHTAIRDLLGNSKSIMDIKNAVLELRSICSKECQSSPAHVEDKLPHPHWICQPYVRPPVRHDSAKSQKRPFSSISTDHQIVTKISKKKMKKLLKKHGELLNGVTATQEQIEKILDLERSKRKIVFQKCLKCCNPRGENCVYSYCKTCCKVRAKELEIECPKHNNKKSVKS